MAVSERPHVPDHAREHAEALVHALGASVEDVPPLVRVLEDLAALRRFEELSDRGETRTHAIRRTASEFGFPEATLRYRLTVLRERPRPKAGAAFVAAGTRTSPEGTSPSPAGRSGGEHGADRRCWGRQECGGMGSTPGRPRTKDDRA